MPSDPSSADDGIQDLDDDVAGLAPERTRLAWGRSGLAVVVAVGVLSRKVWTLDDGLAVVGLVIVALGSLTWMAGMRESRRLHLDMEPHGATGRHAFALVATGTLVLAAGGLVFGVLVPS